MINGVAYDKHVASQNLLEVLRIIWPNYRKQHQIEMKNGVAYDKHVAIKTVEM